MSACVFSHTEMLAIDVLNLVLRRTKSTSFFSPNLTNGDTVPPSTLHLVRLGAGEYFPPDFAVRNETSSSEHSGLPLLLSYTWETYFSPPPPSVQRQ